MKKKFTITEEDYFHYQWHMFKKNPTAKRTMYIQMALPILVFIAIAIFYYATGKALKGLLPLGVVLVLWPFIYQFFFNRTMKKKLKQLIQKMKKDLPIGDHHASMDEKGIHDGDIVVVEQTPEARNGEIVVAMMEDEATVKRFYKENGHFRLQPENDAFEPIIVTEVAILGKVVALLRYY